MLEKVPPHTAYSSAKLSTGTYRYYSDPPEAAVASLFEYWGLTTSPESVLYRGNTDLSSIFDLAVSLNKVPKFKAKVEALNFEEIRDHIKLGKPLIVQIPIISIGKTINSAAIIVGFDETNQSIIVHQYWLGDNFKIRFKDLIESGVVDSRGNILGVVFDREDAGEPSPISFTYDSEGSLKRQAESKDFFASYAVGLGFRVLKPSSGASIPFFEKAAVSDWIGSVHPFYQVLVFSYVALGYAYEKKWEDARQWLIKAQSLNHDLNISYGSWPVSIFENMKDELDMPYAVLGFVALGEGKLKESEEMYTRALSINPNNPYAPVGLEQIRLKLRK
ncbi:MAG: hypothetical protein AAB597_02625 [Patescibacteria group bacterium]